MKNIDWITYLLFFGLIMIFTGHLGLFLIFISFV